MSKVVRLVVVYLLLLGAVEDLLLWAIDIRSLRAALLLRILVVIIRLGCRLHMACCLIPN